MPFRSENAEFDEFGFALVQRDIEELFLRLNRSEDTGPTDEDGQALNWNDIVYQGSTEYADWKGTANNSVTRKYLSQRASQEPEWKSIAEMMGDATLGSLSDVSVTGATDGQVLSYNFITNTWVPATLTLTTTLADLTDVTLTTPAADEFLRFDGGEWINAAVTTDDIPEGSNLYWTQARFDTAFSGKTTSNLLEGANLYYTEARVQDQFQDIDEITWTKASGSVTPVWTGQTSVSLVFYNDADLAFSGGAIGVNANSTHGRIGWFYGGGRAIMVGAKSAGVLALMDGVQSGGVYTEDGTDPITYTASATDSSRELDVDVALTLQGASSSNGDVILADSDGKPEWSGPPSGTPAWRAISVCESGVTKTMYILGTAPA